MDGTLERFQTEFDKREQQMNEDQVQWMQEIEAQQEERDSRKKRLDEVTNQCEDLKKQVAMLKERLKIKRANLEDL